MIFNAQIGQDKFVCEYFNYKRGGYFLDIGAFDGITISNTYYLEKELGWKGICVEAGNENYQQLIKNRNCLCLHNAISSVNGAGVFCENWTVGKLGKIEIGSNSKIELIEIITIRKLLKDNHCPKLIDYISLDIEGSEYDALTKFPFKTHEAIVFTIEHNSHLDGGEMKEQIRKLMSENGYSLVMEKEKDSAAVFEDWFINSKYDNNKSTR